jgi:opacity protein-like surface antigen
MKRLFLIVVLVMAITLNGFSQFSFSVAPGIATNSATFGYKIGNAVPYAGLQLLTGGYKMVGTNHYQSGSEWVTDKYEMQANVNLIMPSIGVKYFAVETGDLKAYVNLAATKPLISGKMKYNGEEEEGFAEQIDKIKLFGAELGFGMEYFLSRNFSIGGEYSFRYIGGKHSEKDEWGSGEYEKTDISLRLVPTIAKFSLNFYFGGGDGN